MASVSLGDTESWRRSTPALGAPTRTVRAEDLCTVDPPAAPKAWGASFRMSIVAHAPAVHGREPTAMTVDCEAWECGIAGLVITRRWSWAGFALTHVASGRFVDLADSGAEMRRVLARVREMDVDWTTAEPLTEDAHV